MMTARAMRQSWAARVAPVLAAVACGTVFPGNVRAQGSVATDRAALEALYDATGGASWTDNTNWKTSAPLSEWYGVETGTSGRVTGLFLSSNELTGSVPAALGRLASLDNLNLGWNELTGPIPDALGDLANLQSLNLSSNELTGSVPAALGRLASLDNLNLGWNELTGPIPDALGDLVNLRSLILYGNDLTGRVPGVLGRLASLDDLNLGWNELTGPIPDALGNLANLRGLDLSGNDTAANALTGPIPAALANLTNLEFLDLGQNALTGPVPGGLGTLTNLRSLRLGSNLLTGPIPDALGRLARLEHLSLNANRLTGPLPASLGGLANLEFLFVGFNPLSGPLPLELAQLSRLTELWISATDLCAPADAVFQEWLATIDFGGATCNRPPEPVGTIPAQALTSPGPASGVSVEAYFSDPDDEPLTYAATSGHSGTVTVFVSGATVWLIPTAAGKTTVTVTASDPDGLSAIQAVAVTVVASTGPQSDREVLELLYDATGGPDWTDSTNWKTDAPLDDWFGVTTDTDGRVTWLEMNGNSLVGLIPAELGSLENLEVLSLGRNELAGPIPDGLGNLANLRSLYLGGNDLSGPIPAWLGSLESLEQISLGVNELTGRIPNALGNLANLRSLYLGGNDLSGPIPRELANLDNLRALGLGWNDLSGPIPAELGRLERLVELSLWGNELTGRIPNALGNLANLRWLQLGWNDLSGPIPAELGRLERLEVLHLAYNWGLMGPLPSGLRRAPLEELDIWLTQACAPAAWQDWLETTEFSGGLCETGTDVTIDVLVVYTPAAREEAGGTAAINAVIDLMVAETNQAYAESGVGHRVALAEKSEVSYTEVGPSRDIDRLADPSDGYMDEVHTLRDRVGADLVHLIFKDEGYPFGGIANLGGPFGLTCQHCGGDTFAHELGHNMGLLHDRYQAHHNEGELSSHPAYGYVNQRGLEKGATLSSAWATIMAYPTQCDDNYRVCPRVLRFSNPRQSLRGDPLGVPYGAGGSDPVTGPADAAAVLNATGPAVASWRDHVARPNRPPATAGALPDQRLTQSGTLNLEVSQAFTDPDGDPLSYAVSSSAPRVVTVLAAGARVTLTAVAEGTATVQVTATDPGGLSATQSFTVTVTGPSNRPPEPVGVLPPMTIQLDDDAVTVAVSGAFRDPDGDALTYGASSSTPSVASVSMSGSLLTVTPVSEGTATVTVTATDVGGSNTVAMQTFTVTVGAANRPPEAVGTLAALTVGLDEAAVTVDVSGAFRDPDGDALTYGATSSAPAVAAATATTGSAVTVTPVSEGTATVTVTATDVGGSNTVAMQTFTVTVGAANRPPEAVGTLAALTVGLDEAAVTVDVSGAFRDPDGDALTYGATSSAPAVAAATATTGSAVTVTPVSEGTATVTVTATDVGGSNTAATQAFTVTVGAANRPPEAVGTLAALTVGLDEAAVTVDVSGAFRDPDGDALTYGATSSAPAVAAATATGSAVTVTPVSEGTATVTVTATDVGGSNTAATQAFTVTVGAANRPPEAVGTLAALTIGLDEAAVTVDVSSAFRDPDGDALTYGATSSAPAVAAVTATGSVVTVTPVTEGTATVTVTATDVGGSNTAATQAFRVTVGAANRPPEAVGTLGPLTVGLDEAAVTVDVSGAFRDPDGDALTYGATSSAPAVAAVTATGSVVTVTPVAEGTTTVTVTATDVGGSNTAATQAFRVTVGAANRPPEAVGTLGPLTIGFDEAAATVDLSGAFRDPDGDALTYGATSSSPDVATVSVTGSTVTVAPVAEGTALVTVKATDPGGLSATGTFVVTVGPAANRPPEAVGTLAPLTVGVEESVGTVEVSGAFRDPDGDALSYGASSSAPSVASVSVSGSRVTVTPVSEGTALVTVTATDTTGSNTTAAQTFTVTVTGSSNRPPEPVGMLAPVTLAIDEDAVAVDVSGAFRDPEGDALTYAATSSSPSVATVSVSRSTVTVTPVAPGTALVTVTATDTTGSNTSATQTFAVTVPAPFTDRVIVPGETPIRAVHITELRARIDAVRSAAGLGRFGWTDPVLTAGVTPVRLTHLLELRSAVAAAYASSGRSAPIWTDPEPEPGATPIRAAHLMELRTAVVALE